MIRGSGAGIDETELMDILASHAEEMGIILTKPKLEMFNIYLKLILEWNSRMNLTSITEPYAIVVNHFLDSLIPGPYVKGDLLDLGSGAGLPGIPLKIALSDLSVTLLEGRRKKVSFLKHVIRELGLNGVTVINRYLRSGETIGSFDTIITRALGPPYKVIPIMLPNLSARGRLVLMIGKETRLAEALLKDYGLKLLSLHPYHLPRHKNPRNIVVLHRDVSRET